MTSVIAQARASFFDRLINDGTLSVNESGVASNADASQRTSRFIARNMAASLGVEAITKKLDGQRAGKLFEIAVQQFLFETFPRLHSLRPGQWRIENVGGSRGEYHISRYEPYTHLDELASAIEQDPTLASVLGNSYEISPDILILREPENDEAINKNEVLVDNSVARYSIIRNSNQKRPIVHAIVSCKWTLRSDRAQNARSEALNMIRNRKGRTPHIVVVTAEPTPSRLASLALGTGDVDTVYHFALPELIDAVRLSQNDEAQSMLDTLIAGKRLRDIADLPLDLSI